MGSGSQNCPRVHGVCCSLHARIVHTARTHRARCTHALCTLHARTHCAYCTHARCTLTHCARCTHALCTLHARTVHAARTHCARFTHALCTLHARMVHAARTHPLCTLHARIVHAARPHLAHCAVQWTCIELVAHERDKWGHGLLLFTPPPPHPRPLYYGQQPQRSALVPGPSVWVTGEGSAEGLGSG